MRYVTRSCYRLFALFAESTANNPATLKKPKQVTAEQPVAGGAKLRGQESRPNILRERVLEHAERARILPGLRSDFTAGTAG